MTTLSAAILVRPSSQRGASFRAEAFQTEPRWLGGNTMQAGNRDVLNQYLTHLRIAKRSQLTIEKRFELLRRLGAFLGTAALLAATKDDLTDFQATFAHLAPASVNIYSRHIRAFYSWAYQSGRIPADPAAGIAVPHVRKGKPHPISAEDLATVFGLTRSGPLRVPYVLAAFAGLRCGEICRLQTQALDIASPYPTALIAGKGDKERYVPLLAPVVAELRRSGLPRRGWVATLPNGRPYTPNRLSVDSHQHLAGIGVVSTLHSMRHYFATFVANLTHDPLLVRDLLGHESVATSEIYMETSVHDAHARLAGLTAHADSLLGPVLRVVR